MSSSSRMRVTGFSGMDVESMVQQLMDAESLKLNKYKRDVTRTEWTRDAYRTQATALKTLKSDYLSTSGAKASMLSPSSYSNFKNTVKLSNGNTSSAVGVTANSKSKIGTYKVDTFAVAKGASATATGLGMKSSSATNLTDIANAMSNGEGFKMKVDGTEAEIKLDQTEFGALGIDTTDGMDATETAALEDAINKKLSDAFGSVYKQGTTAAQIQADPTANREGVIKIDLSATSVEFSTNTNKTYDLQDDTAGSGLIGKMGLSAGSSDYTKKKLSDIDPAYSNGATFDIGGKTISVTDPDATVQDVLDAINESGGTVKASYDSYKKAFTFTSTKTGNKSELGLDDTADGDFAKIFGADTVTAATAAKGTDAVIQVTDQDGNTRILESSTSVVKDSVSGVDFTVNSMAAETLEVNVERDTTKTVDMIKDFLASYNTMLTGLRDSVNTRRAKSDSYTYYEPLLEEEKSELTDKQVEQMEDKAKQGLLYRDSALSQIIDQMENMMMNPLEIDGKSVSLADMGITTSPDYRQGGVLVINDEEKLNAFVEEHSDLVSTLFSQRNPKGYTSSSVLNGDVSANEKMKNEGLAWRLSTIVDLATDTTKGSITHIAGLNETDSQSELYLSLRDKNEKIELMKDQLDKKEENYYRKFSAMETAMSKANNQISSLLAQLGQ